MHTFKSLGIVRDLFLFLKGIYYIWSSAHDMQTKIYSSWPNIKNLFPHFIIPFSPFSSIAARYTYLFPYFDLNKLVQHGHNVLIRGNELQLLLQFKIYFLMLAKSLVLHRCVFSVFSELKTVQLNISVETVGHLFFQK